MLSRERRSATNFESVVTNGQVVVDVGPALPDGTAVQVTVKAAEESATPAVQPTMKWLLRLAGSVHDMPSDFAEQHDHYIHGTPKR